MMTTSEFLQQIIQYPEKLNSLVCEAKECAFQHGNITRINETPTSSEAVTYLPFTLFPSPMPKAIILQALAVQTHFNILVDKISQDPDFLEEALAGYKKIHHADYEKILFRRERNSTMLHHNNVTFDDSLSRHRTIQVDDFTANLFDIYKQIQQEGLTQSIAVGLNRIDYMVDHREDGPSPLKQVEINTIAAGGLYVSDCLPVVHRHILRSAGLLEESKYVQDRNNSPGMCAALAKGWELYGQQKAVILFLVESHAQINKLNHRVMEKNLWDRNIPVIRRKFEDVYRRGSLHDDRRFFIDGQEVAVVYYRYGYMPNNYTEESWDARLMMERSLAVKCPDIGTHLAGTKKVQQVLARPGVLERFFPDQPQVVEQIRATFVGLYTLDMGPEGDKTVEMALAAPERFVLKPQREGGGNNIYGSAISEVLQRLKDSPERMAYILMDKIQPFIVKNILLKRSAPLQISDCVSELGVLGAYVRYVFHIHLMYLCRQKVFYFQMIFLLSYIVMNTIS
ncbi:glutathione synthetase-like isoform X2 [Antennarius striatus]|uniref:glutathione synthetase-like isoform X2 n=1 Tax=Antennarius striatus TaxID=241820 RepID=UPI0035B2ED69